MKNLLYDILTNPLENSNWILLLTISTIAIIIICKILNLINRLDDKLLNWVARTNYKYLTKRNMEKLPIADKQKHELIEGNWYELFSSNRWIFKYAKTDKDGTICNYLCCTPEDGYVSSGSGNTGWITYKDVKPANMDEVYKYFPEEKREFKVGDWVIRIQDTHLDMRIGDIDQITELFGLEIKLSRFKSENNRGTHSKINFRFATPEEIACNDPCLKTEGFKESMKEELTSLPEEWSIKITSENRKTLHNWRTDKSINELEGQTGKYLLSLEVGKRGYCVPNLSGYSEFKEITFDQFKKWVLKESVIETKPKFEIGKWYKRPFLYGHDENKFRSYFKCEKIDINGEFYTSDEITESGIFYNLNSSTHKSTNNLKEISISEIQAYLPEGHVDKIKTIHMKDIQEECKKRFPIGCKYKSATNKEEYTLQQDSDTYKINREMIWGHGGAGCLYHNNQYATLISLPESNKSLVGRWFKGLIKDAHCSSIEINQYYEIKEQSVDSFKFKHPLYQSYISLRLINQGIHFELMPEGFIPPNTIKAKLMKYKIGDSVEILNISEYKTDNDGIPRKLMIHGSATLHRSDPKAKIVDIYNEFYIVNFINAYGSEMQLGYLEQDLELKFSLKEEDWCVYSDTYEFSEEIKPYFDKYPKGNDPRYNGSKIHYGIKDGARYYCNIAWGKLLSKEEFYQKVGKSMTKEELLIEAKRRFPIGTKYNSTGGANNCEITKESEFYFDCTNEIRVNNSYEKRCESGVYRMRDNIWAEIISKPEESKNPCNEISINDVKPKTNNNYEVNLIIPRKSVYVTLKNTESEVKIKVNNKKTIKL